MDSKPNTNTGKQKRMMSMLTKTGMQGRRHAIVWDVTKGRSESSKDLTELEVDTIIEALELKFKELDACDKMRRKLISLARQMNWEIKAGNQTKCDMDRLDAWCLKYGQYKKALNSHEYDELINIITQFKKAHSHFFKAI